MTEFSHATLRENVAVYLRNRILRGEIEPGEKINEVEVARQLSISRGPVREALRQVEQEGFVSYTPNKGCTVKTLSPDDMAEVYLLRCTLETLSIRVCGGNMRESTLKRLYDCCDALGAAAKEKDLPKITAADQAFHATIVQEAGLEMLYKTWSGFDGGNAAIYYTMQNSNLMPLAHLDRNHRMIADAFRDGTLEEQVQVIQHHYKVVPEQLYRFNQQQPHKILEVFQYT